MSAPAPSRPDPVVGGFSAGRVPSRRGTTSGARSTTRLASGLITLVLLLGPHTAVAGPSSPTPITVDPAGCTIAPRPLADLERILATATPGPRPPRPATADPIPLESATGQAIVETITALFDCLDAGERLRAYALYTDAYLASILQPGDLDTIATPYPPSGDDRTRILAIELFATSDDRVLAKVSLRPVLIPVDKIFEFILVEHEGHWRIDAVINEIDFSIP